MLRKAFIATAVLTSLTIAAPASAGGWGGSTSGGWGGSSSGGGCGKKCGGSTTSGGTQVPEPGMLGIAGAGLIGLGLMRRRRASKD